MATRSTTDLKQDYLDETDAEEGNIGSVAPRELDAMGIRNDGKTPFDAVQGLDDNEIQDNDDELNDDTDVKNIGVGIEGNAGRTTADALLEDTLTVDELDDQVGDGDLDDTPETDSDDEDSDIEEDIEDEDDDDDDDDDAGEEDEDADDTDDLDADDEEDLT